MFFFFKKIFVPYFIYTFVYIFLFYIAMKTVYYFLIGLCMGFIWGSCEDGSAFKAQDLNGKWTIVSVMDEQVTLENMPFLEFNVTEKRLNGNIGCNNLTAGFVPDSEDATAFQVISPATTMMACIHFDTETKIAMAINNMTHVRKGEKANQVKLIDSLGYTLIVLEKN